MNLFWQNTVVEFLLNMAMFFGTIIFYFYGSIRLLAAYLARDRASSPGGWRPACSLACIRTDTSQRALQMSGKGTASLPLPPLRTGLDGFPSSGSSRV
jgi:hypothetical protein